MEFTNNNSAFAPLIGMGQAWHGIISYLNGLKAISVEQTAFTEKYGSWTNPQEVIDFLGPLADISEYGHLISDTAPTGKDLPNPIPDITDSAPQNMFSNFVWCTLRFEALAQRFVDVYAKIDAGKESPTQVRALLTGSGTGLVAQCKEQQADNEQLRQKLVFVGPTLRKHLTELHSTTIFNYAYQAGAYWKRKIEQIDADIQSLKDKFIVLGRARKIADLEAQKQDFLQEMAKKEVFLKDLDGFSMANFNNISAFDLLIVQAQATDNWLKATIAMLERVGSLDDQQLANQSKLVTNLDIQNMTDRWNIIQQSGKISIKTALSH